MAKLIEKKVEEKVTGVVIELTLEEAETLRGVCKHIGGCPINSPRKHIDSISAVLDKAGICKTKELKRKSHADYIAFEEYY